MQEVYKNKSDCLILHRKILFQNTLCCKQYAINRYMFHQILNMKIKHEEYRTRSLLQKWIKEYLDIVKTNNSLVAADH